MIDVAARKLGALRALASRALSGLRTSGTAEPDELFSQPWPVFDLSVDDADAALQAGADRPSRVAADALHLVSLNPRGDATDEARRLVSEGYRPRSDAPLWSVRLPIDWAGDPFNDRNWCSQLNMLRLLDPLIRAYEAGGNTTLLATALTWALDWHDYHVVRGRNHALAWRDMMTGVRSLRLAYLADRLRTGALDATPAQRRTLAHAVVVHWHKLTTPGFFRYSNHTIWDLHGLTALVRATFPDGDPRHAGWMKAVGGRLDHLVASQFDERGIHRENSPQYHFVASAMFRTLVACDWYTAVAPCLSERLQLARTQEPWMRLPDGRHIPIGDSDGKPPKPSSRLPQPAAAVEGDHTTWLNHSCYCFVRRLHDTRAERWACLAIKAGFDDAGHKHDDELSYLWSESGCDIVVDAGKYAYDQNPMRSHVLGKRAHNLITFGGTDDHAAPVQGTGHLVQALEQQPWGVQIVARMRHRLSGVDHERRWWFAPGRWLVVIDRFRAPQALHFTHWTHLAPEFVVQPDRARLHALHVRGGALTIAHWASVDVVTRHYRGQEGPQPQGWISRGYRSIEPAPAIGLSGRASQASIVMALSLEPESLLTCAHDGALTWSAREVTLALEVGGLAPTIGASQRPASP